MLEVTQLRGVDLGLEPRQSGCRAQTPSQEDIPSALLCLTPKSAGEQTRYTKTMLRTGVKPTHTHAHTHAHAQEQTHTSTHIHSGYELSYLDDWYYRKIQGTVTGCSMKWKAQNPIAPIEMISKVKII